MTMKWILTATFGLLIGGLTSLTPTLRAHEVVLGLGSAPLVSGMNGDTVTAPAVVFDDGEFVRMVYTPSAADIAASMGTTYVILFEVGGSSNGTLLSLRNGQVQLISKMISSNNANDCLPDPAVVGDYWLTNVGNPQNGEHHVGLNNPLTLVAGQSYVISFNLHPAIGQATLLVNNSFASVAGTAQGGRSWVGNSSLGWGTANGSIGAGTGDVNCTPYRDNAANGISATGELCGSFYNDFIDSFTPCTLDGLVISTDGPLSVSPGQSITFDIELENGTGDNIAGVCITDTLPPGLVFDMPAHNFNTAVGFDGAGNPVVVPVTATITGGTQITWKVGSTNTTFFMPDGATYQIEVYATTVMAPDACGTATNRVSAQANVGVTEEGTGCTVLIDPDLDLAEDQIEFAVVCPDLAVSKTMTNLTSGGSMMAVNGDLLEYTITYQNIGAGDALNIQVCDVVPPGTTLVPGSLMVPAGTTVLSMSPTIKVLTGMGTGAGSFSTSLQGSTNLVAVQTGGNAQSLIVSNPTATVTDIPTDGLVFRLDAGQNVLTTGTAVTGWNDNGPAGVNFVQGTAANQPTLVPGVINGLPVVRFDGADDRVENISQQYYATLFAVVNRTGGSGSCCDGLFGHGPNPSDKGLRINNGDLGYRGPGGAANDANDFANGNGFVRVNGATVPANVPPLAPHIVEAHRGNGYNARQVNNTYLGWYFANRVWGGDIAEFIAYDRTLSEAENQAVGAYLAAKYAIDADYEFQEDGCPDEDAVGPAARTPVSTLYDFDTDNATDDGAQLDGWVDVVGTSFPSSQIFVPTGIEDDDSGGRGASDDGVAGGQDNAHPNLIIRSPAFRLDNNSYISGSIAGGEGTANMPADDAAVVAFNGGNSNDQGVQMALLRRDSDGAYLLNGRRLGNGNGYEPFYWDAATLAAVVDANDPCEIYTVDWVDTFSGGWGFAMIDDVVIQAVPETFNAVTTTYETVITSCPDIASWDQIRFDVETPASGTYQVDILDGTNVFLSLTDPTLVDISSAPAVSNLTVSITLETPNYCESRFCDATALQAIDYSYNCEFNEEITFQVVVDRCDGGQSIITNMVTITNDVQDLNLANNVFVLTNQLKSWDLCLGKVGFVDVLPPRRAPFPPLPTVVTNCATSVVYVITVTNLGEIAAPNAMVIDDLPAELTFVSGTGCTATGQTVYCSIGDLAAGSVTSVVLVTELAGCLANDIINSARAMPMCGDFNPSNNTASTTNAVIPDLTPPTFTSLPPDLNVCNQDLAPLLVDPTTDETCVGSLTTTTVSTVTGCVLRVERTFDLIDLCGLSTSHTQVIEINIDTNKPMLIAPPNAFVCNTPVTDMMFTNVMAADDCLLPLAVSFTASTTPLIFCPGEVITRTWTAVDGCGNQSTAIQLITNSFDTAPPIITAMDMDGCNLDTSVAALGMATVDDANCAFTLSWTDTVATVGCGDVISRTWIAVDACGNTGMVVQTISNVVDTTPPSLTIPADTNGCGISTAIADTGTATATDLCSTMLTITNTDVVLLQGGNEIIFRTWEATDACGNVASDVQLIVNSTNFTGPALMLPPDTNACNGADQPAATGMAMVIDTCCGTSTLVFVDNMLVGAGSCGGDLIERIWTASDSCGSISLTQLIDSVADVTPPMLVLPADTNLCNATDTSVAALGSATATDDCILISTTWTDTVPNSACGDEISRVWTATDACGNVASATQLIVNLIDTDAPVLTIPADETGCNLAASTNMATAVDACSSATVWFVDAAATQDCVVVISRTWYATDVCGNQTSAVQNIASTEDFDAPMITVSDVSGCEVLANAPPASATDACALATLSSTDTVAIVGCTTLVTRVWTAVDDCGNMSSATQTIESITDAGAPLITFVPADSVECGGGDTSPATLGMTTATGGCAVVVTWSDAVLTTPCGDTISRTWVAADECGNSTSAVQVIQVLTDGVAPILQIPADAELCSALDDPGTAVATDGCGATTLTSSDVTTVVTCGVSVATQIIRTWTATDLCGNVTSDDQIILVSAGEAPVINSIPSNMTGCAIDIASLPQATADGCLAITFNLVESTVNSGCVQVVTREWTFANACGTTSAVQIVNNILDVDAPLIVIPSDVEGCQLDLTNIGVAMAADACSGVSVSFSDQVIPFDCGVRIRRTWSATDGCGNSSEGVQNILNNTNTAPPVITVAPASVSGCNLDIAALPMAEALGCADMTTTFLEETTNNGCVVTITREWIFATICGSTSHVQVIVSTDDTLAPVLALPADVSDCNLADTSPAALGMATASDVCGNVTVSWTDVSSITGCEETIVRTWTAEDNCGNTASADQTIVNRTDAEAPMITAPADVRLCNINGAITPGMATVNDNCGTVTVTFVDAVAQIGCEFTITRTWTATDPCGNSATASQTIITETDPEAPALTMPADTVVCDPADSNPLVTGFAVSTDNCSSATVEFADTSVTDGCATIITRTWTAVDRCGLTNAYEQIITVFNDTDAPEITVADETFCMLSTNVVTPADALVTDGCSSANVSLVESSSILGCDETLTRIWTATDQCGNRSVVTQIVTITRDTTFSFTIPADADGCNLDTSTVGTGEASVTSDCPLAAPTFIDTTATTGCGQSIIRIWSAQDVCGVLYTGTQLITTVIDTDAPVIDLADASGCNIGTSVVDVGMPVVTDNCDTPTLVNDDSVTTQDCVLVITRVWTATDGCGNSSAATQTIMSTIDTDGPVITVANVSGCGVLATAPAATATDDCGGAALSSSDELVQNGCIQTVTRTWTAQDDCGNISTAVQTIENIVDAGAPVFVDVPEDFTGCNLLITNPTVFATATDDCGDPDITFSDTSSQAGCVVTILREWTATDVCGNVATSIQTFVNTIDAEAPVITIPADVSGCNVSSAASPAGSGLATATDNCNATVTFADMLAPSNPASCETFILRTWTATDDCGNSSSGIQRITIINDNTPPVMDCPTAMAIFPDAAGNFTVPNLVPMASATDDCPGGVTITQAPAPGSVFGSTFPATASIVVTSRDACGNEAQCMVQITSASCIAGIAFDDFNSNGIQDSAAGDGPTAGVEVILYDVNDTEVARTTTRADGSYIFFMDPADPSTAVARGTQSGASFTLGLGPNEAAPTSLIDPVTGRSAPIVLMTGEHRLNQDIGISKSGTIQGFIWNDIANTGDPRGANLVELGFNGANVTLLRLEPDGSSSVVATTTTATDDMGNMGAYSFDGLPPGDYQVTLDPDSLPDNLGATPTLTSDPLGLGAGQTLLNGTNFPLMFGSGPTAIELVSLDATGGSIIWTTADESDVLGYNIIDLATGEAVNEALILANGNGGSYELAVDQGSYALESVDTALGTSRDAEATHYQEVDASPQGEPTDVVEAEGGQASFTTREGTLSYLVTGVASGISVLDVSDPDNPVRLLVELLQTDTGNAVYFSHPAGAQIEVR